MNADAILITTLITSIILCIRPAVQHNDIFDTGICIFASIVTARKSQQEAEGLEASTAFISLSDLSIDPSSQGYTIEQVQDETTFRRRGVHRVLNRGCSDNIYISALPLITNK